MPRHNISALCRKIGVSTNTFYSWVNWRKTGIFPGEDNLAKLAQIGNLPIDTAIFALLAEKSKIPELSECYREYANRPTLN
ncbi:helix-turn-helix domain-containing protein [Celerinatantimonas sp. MCCC 1A17872]|uniref:helix-turn-helix domain-containing protein n=1 Tax=Celerinatantimonas sp. MCCC 1A17872 TaxID=3177514 RepID=UPI0038C863BF